MNAARKLMLMILVGILIAAGIIAGVTALEQSNYITGPQSSVVTSRTTVTTVNPNLQTGVLAAQITDPPDPPNMPAGTSHVYIQYSDIEAHTTNQNNSIWFTVAKSGSIDLLSVLNVSLTLGSAKVYSGVYDQARFDITNATVTFGGVNYTASVPLDQIIVPLSNGGALVKPNASAGFVIDITPTVLALNTGGKPSFEIVTAAQGLTIPTGSWTSTLAVPGSVIQNVSSQSWWKGPTPIGDNLAEVPGSEIYPTTLLVILNNTGTTPVTISALNILSSGQGTQSNTNVSTSTIVSTITMVTTITEVTTITGNSNGATSPVAAAPQASPKSSSPTTVATFLILSNGSVIQPSPKSAPIPTSQVGLTIKPHQVVVLLYLGYINTLNSPNPPYEPQSIIGGQEYTIQIVTPFGSYVEFNVHASYTS